MKERQKPSIPARSGERRMSATQQRPGDPMVTVTDGQEAHGQTEPYHKSVDAGRANQFRREMSLRQALDAGLQLSLALYHG